MKHEPYACIRCGYSTEHKSKMKLHFSRKKPCPATKNVIDVTDEIKEHILANRVYRIPKEVPITQNINYYNTMNNFITSKDPLVKLAGYTDYKNVHVMNFDDQISERFYKINEKMYDHSKSYRITYDQICGVIDDVTRCRQPDLSDFNIMYDKKNDRIKVKVNNNWDDYSIHNGIKFICETLKENYLDNYEAHLICKLESPSFNAREKSEFKELLDDYYQFISCFEFEPYISSEYSRIFDEVERSPDLVDQYMSMFRTASDKLTVSKQKKIKNDILDMIKYNGTQNIQDLNKIVLTIINVDKDFKQYLMG